MNKATEYLKSCGTFYLATDEEGQLIILVREYRCSGGTETANPAAWNR